MLSAINFAKKNNSTLHLIGLLSDGGVHSHNTHLYSLIELAKKNGLIDLEIHCITDGRDVSPTSSPNYVKELMKKTKQIGLGHIASIMGRYYGMDRNRQWDRVELAYNALINGEGEIYKDPLEAIKSSYLKGVTDEFIKPLLIEKDNGELGTVKDNDAIIFFNFRPDRAREITRAFVDDDFSYFDRKKINVKYVCMTMYDKTIKNVEIAYKPNFVQNTLGEYLSKLGIKQLRAVSYTHLDVYKRQVLICPPFTSLYPVIHELKNSSIKVGAQNMHFENSGAFTGEVSPPMLKNIGVEYVIIGHSERRQHFGETDQMVNKKVKAALNNGLKPILCVGESLEQREAGVEKETVRSQLIKDLDGIREGLNIVVAYEPIWAIGTGRNATSAQACLLYTSRCV